MSLNSAILKISVTGPECSGKSELSSQLATVLNTVYVPEYARVYLENLDRSYNQADLNEIAAGQVQSEDKMSAVANKYLICDTDMLVLYIWSLFKFKSVDRFIESLLDARDYDYYLLCRPDLEWIYDPLRENPGDRDQLFEMYRDYLVRHGKPFTIIEGQGDERLNKAMDAIQRIAWDN